MAEYQKMRGLLIFFAVAFTIHHLSVEAMAEKKIGILLWSDEARYLEARNGIMDQMKANGYGSPEITYSIRSAAGGKAQAVEAARKFDEIKMDLIITIGTSATLPVARAIKTAPIVFSSVYDPIEAGIANDWTSSGNNTTGSSSRVPMSIIITNLKKLVPVRRLAVLYTPGEKNSELQLKEMQLIQSDPKIKVIPIILTDKKDVAQALSGVAQTVDAFYLTGSSIVGDSVPVIADIANKANVVTITHLDDLIEKGALLGVCPNSYLLGKLAGEKAVKVLKGAKPSSIPVEPLNKFDLILNKKSVKAGGFQVPPSFMKMVTKTVE